MARTANTPPVSRRSPNAPAHSASANSARTAWLTPQIAAGDETAFETFYELWFDRSLALARRITRRDESFCLDVVQDCMMRVVRSVPVLTTEAAVDAWMARTILTNSIDRLRAERRRQDRERHAARGEAKPPERALALLDAEQATWLQARIAELPERDRELLAARFTHDRTLAATGAMLGLTTNAVHGRLRRILSKLREHARGVFHDD